MVNGWRRFYSAFLKSRNHPHFTSPSPYPCSLYSLESLAHLLGLGDLVLLKSWILKVTLVLAKLQGESKAYFCIAWHYKTKAAPYVNLFNMTIFSQQRAGARLGVQAILT